MCLSSICPVLRESKPQQEGACMRSEVISSLRKRMIPHPHPSRFRPFIIHLASPNTGSSLWFLWFKPGAQGSSQPRLAGWESGWCFYSPYEKREASQVVSVVKNPPTYARDLRDPGSIPGSGRSPGGGTATHSSILAWIILWTEEPGGL